MKFGLDVSIAGEYSNPRMLADLAAEAEQVGWNGFFVQDYMISYRPITDPWVALTAIVMRTERVRIGAFMTALPRRRPWKVARENVSIDHLSNGRLIFGAGLGFQTLDFTAFGESDNLKIRALPAHYGLCILTNQDFNGKRFHFDEMVQKIVALSRSKRRSCLLHSPID